MKHANVLVAALCIGYTLASIDPATAASVDVSPGFLNPGEVAVHGHEDGSAGEMGNAKQTSYSGSPTVTIDPSTVNCGAGPTSPATMPICSVATPRIPGPPKQAATNNPAKAAIDYFNTLKMPIPAPTISAPQGICGVQHSLDLHIPARQTFTDPNTPLGPLTLQIFGRFTVKWRDGFTDVYSTSGAPWPRSGIQHSWSDRGTYNITVTALWSASWSYAGETGTITGLRTAGAINNWQVIELQAVITDD